MCSRKRPDRIPPKDRFLTNMISTKSKFIKKYFCLFDFRFSKISTFVQIFFFCRNVDIVRQLMLKIEFYHGNQIILQWVNKKILNFSVILDGSLLSVKLVQALLQTRGSNYH